MDLDIEPTHADARDFDFFHGSWKVSHRRLNTRLAGADDWETFGGTTVVQPVLGGMGNIDDNSLELPGGAYRALTLRTFDPPTGTWSIWWLDGRQPTRLDTPMRGSFEAGLGTFFADDTFDGKPIKVRFLWKVHNPDQPVWEQAFSVDEGKTWETNWIMRFTRVAQLV
jgi:hypothetical protein